MEGIKTIIVKLQPKYFRFSEPQQWRGISYVWGDYHYSKHSIVAKYIFLYVDRNSWQILSSEKEAFVTEIIEDAYYALHNDLRWNMYVVCVVEDKEFPYIDRCEKASFEGNILYTRNYLISESMLETRIPIGQVLSIESTFQFKYPIKEWLHHMGKYASCIGFHSDNMPSSKQSEQNDSNRSGEVLKIQKITNIQVPQSFRPHLYKKDWLLPCTKFNLLYGATGTGKTSILSAIELCVTGSVYKPGKREEDIAEKSNVVLTLSNQGEETTLKKPANHIQTRKREADWYHYQNKDSTVSMLNSLFHRFNYFSVDISSEFTSPSEMKNIFSKLLYGADTTRIWDTILYNQQQYKETIKFLRNEYNLINRQSNLPYADHFYEFEVKKYFDEAGFTAPPNTSVDEILKFVSYLRYILPELPRPIYQYNEAEEKLQSIERNIKSYQTMITKIERKMKKLNSVHTPGGVISSMFSSNSQSEDKYFELENTKQRYQNLSKDLQDKAEQLRMIIVFWERVSPWLDQNDFIMGEKLAQNGSTLCKHIDELIRSAPYMGNRNGTEKRKKELFTQLSCYEEAYAKLVGLKSPEDYVDDFIQNNIAHISQIFINLHMPYEFTELRIVDNEIVGIRNEETVPVVNMSTGQKRALLFSVFFQLHLSTPEAPSLLLFDEPTAHIDSMNSLQLMDFLRELVITYDRQLFVTTNNRNVANLLRRKFSFLDNSFQEIEFNRYSKESYEIKRRLYNPQKLTSENILGTLTCYSNTDVNTHITDKSVALKGTETSVPLESLTIR